MGDIIPYVGGEIVKHLDYSVALDLLEGVYDFLSEILPTDPIPAYIGTLPPGLSLGIGWLNWVFPVGECFAFFGFWLATLAGVAAAPRLKEIVKTIVGFLV